MAVQNQIIKIRVGNKETFVNTSDLELLFKALGIDGITLSKDGGGNLVINAPIIAPAGSGPTALATQGALDAEIARATAAEGSLAADLAQEVADRTADVDAEEARALAAEGVLQGNIDDEEDRALTAEGILTTNLAAEVARATAAEGVLTADLAAETSARIADVDAEEARALAAESALETRLDTAESDIDDLQTDLAAILANTPKEQLFDGDGTTTVFEATAPGLQWDADNAVRDIEVELDGRTQERSVAGDFSDGVWRKTSTTEIEFQTAPGVDRRVRIWKQGTSSGSGGGGGGGAGQTVGNPADAFYLLDQGDNTTVWKLSVINGVLDIEAQ